jgi:hypothetical protein
LPLGIVSYLIKDRKTAITLNIIMTVLLFWPFILVGLGIIISIILSKFS